MLDDPDLVQQARAANKRAIAVLLVLSVIFVFACATAVPRPVLEAPRSELVVTATAYNSTVAQTDSDPFVSAHGVRLEPGMQIIAVSRDLESMGLTPSTRVQIEGLPGEWAVADRMAQGTAQGTARERPRTGSELARGSPVYVMILTGREEKAA